MHPHLFIACFIVIYIIANGDIQDSYVMCDVVSCRMNKNINNQSKD